MSCPTEQLAAAFPSLPVDLEDHVAECARCADVWSGYRALADLVGALPEPEPPSQLEVRRARRALVASARLLAARAAVGRRGPDRAARPWLNRGPRRLAALAAAGVLIAGGTLLSSPLGPRREPRVADPPAGEAPASGSSVPGASGSAEPGSARAARPSAAAPTPDEIGARPDELAGIPGAPFDSGRRSDSEGRSDSIDPVPPAGGDSRQLTLHELRERWAFIGIGPVAGAPAGPWTAPRSPAPEPRPGGATVAAGRVALPGLPGRSPAPGREGGGDSPSGGAGPRDPELRDPGDGAEEPDDEATCGDTLARRFSECLTDNGLDPAHPDDREEATAIASECWRDAAAAMEACCAATPDDTCAEPSEPGAERSEGSCADVLFAENDRCLAQSGIEDPSNPATEADREIAAYCWIDVANGAFDACCAETPDPTCQ